MTPEQLEEFKRMVEENNKAQKAMFETLLDAMEIAKIQLKEIRGPFEEFNSKTKKLGSFLSTLNKASEIEGHSGSRGYAGAVHRTLHKKAVGIIRD